MLHGSLLLCRMQTLWTELHSQNYLIAFQRPSLSLQDDCPIWNTGVHAVVHIDHSISTSNVGNSTPVTASNKDGLHKLSSQNLEKESCELQDIAGQLYVGILQNEQLSSLNDSVQEPAIK